MALSTAMMTSGSAAATDSRLKSVVPFANAVGRSPVRLDSAQTPMPVSVEPVHTGTMTGVTPSASSTSASPIPIAATVHTRRQPLPSTA